MPLHFSPISVPLSAVKFASIEESQQLESAVECIFFKLFICFVYYQSGEH